MSDKECSESSTSESSSSSSSETETDCADKSEAETDNEKDCAEKKSETDCAVEKSESDCVEKSDSDTTKTKKPEPQKPPELCNVKTQTNDSKKDCETEKIAIIKKEIKTIKKKDACTQTEEIAVGESAILCTIEAETPEDKIMAWFNPVDQHWDG